MQWNIIRYLKGRKGTSLVVQWLRLCTSNVEARVQSLVKELRPNVPCGAAKKGRKF